MAREEKIEKKDENIDPICGMIVSKDPTLKSDYSGQTYYFCSSGCKDQFDMEPERYALGITPRQ